MLRRLLRNKKGTAEIIGSVMFIVILLFFFTNVYLWHDAATKEMNDLYVEKINSPIVISVYPTSPSLLLNVTNRGGMDASLSRLWVVVQSQNGPDVDHRYFPITDQVVKAGSSINITIPYLLPSKALFKVVTTVGNSAACTFP